MNFSRYIAASTLSHILLLGLLWITFLNIKPTVPVFNVDIVAPPETVKIPLPKSSQPDIKVNKPPVQMQQRPVPDEKVRPQALYGEGEGVSPQIAGKDHFSNKEGNTPLFPLDRGEHTPLSPLDRGELTGKGERGFSEKGEEIPPANDTPAVVPPSVLFDKQTIENYAKKESHADSTGDKKLTFELPGFKHRGYMKILKERIEGVWLYPKEAARLGISGDLYIRFTIKRDGKLGDVELQRTSGHKDLDDAAMKALRDAEPFWPLPDDWEKDDLEINGYFIYIFGNAIVM